MKKLLALLLALVMVLSLAACGGSGDAKADAPAAGGTANDGDASNDPAVTLVYAEVNPLDTIVGQTGTFFAEKVAELSGGSIKLDVQAAGVLGSENDVLDAMVGGSDSIDISRISAFALSNYGCTKASLLTIPYTFVDRAHWWNFANSDLAPEFLNEPQTIGLPLRGICYGEEGFRHFFIKDGVEVKGLEDLKGLKIRVPESQLYLDVWSALGATPLGLALPELAPALANGTAEGQDNATYHLVANATYDSIKYFSNINYMWMGCTMAVNAVKWNSLAPEVQEILKEQE